MVGVENAVMAHEVEHSAITTEASAEAAFLLIIMVARKKSRVGSGQVRQDYLWVWEDGATALEMNWLSWSTVNTNTDRSFGVGFWISSPSSRHFVWLCNLFRNYYLKFRVSSCAFVTQSLSSQSVTVEAPSQDGCVFRTMMLPILSAGIGRR